MAKFAIIVSIYNAEKTLQRCLDSIVAQSFTDWEAILVDDGSTDNSGMICDEYAAKDSRFRVILQENGGNSHAMNTGLAHANSEWVTFCDADDWTFDTWLENYLSIENNDSDVLVQGFETDKPLWIGIPETLYGIDFQGNPQEAFCKLKEETILGYTWSKAYRTSTLRKNNLSFDSNITFKQDEEFFVRFLCTASHISCTSRKGYFYYVPNWIEKYNKIKPSVKLISTLFEHEATLFNHDTKRKPLYLAQYFQELCTCIGNSSISLSEIRGFRNQAYNYLPLSDLSSIMRTIIKLDFSGILIKYFIKARIKMGQ